MKFDESTGLAILASLIILTVILMALLGTMTK